MAGWEGRKWLPVHVPAVSPRELIGTTALQDTAGGLGRYTNYSAWCRGVQREAGVPELLAYVR